MLSSSVANAIKMQNRPEYEMVEKFVRLCDRFFDCFNVQNVYEGQKNKKEALMPYTEVDDWRFKVCSL